MKKVSVPFTFIIKRSAIYLCFFISGAAGLIYEVVWDKYLALILGSTTYAHTLVLATFMAGLALGNFFLGSLADKIKNRLSFYAWLEIAVAVFGIFTPNLFVFAKTIYLGIAKSFALNYAGILGVKFLVCALIMLIPTILMGGTLPVLSTQLTTSFKKRGETIARLYYINSAGAVLGTIAAGFYLIYRLGFSASITVAALLNLFAGLAALTVQKSCEKNGAAKEAGEKCFRREPDTAEEENFYSKKIIKFCLFAIFTSGAVAMLYEITWTRLLSLVFGASTYSFSLMLAAFICGITIGAHIISKYMPQTRRAFLVLGLCETAIGLSLIICLPFYERLPYWFIQLSQMFSHRPETFSSFEASKFTLAFLVMLPSTIFLGMTLPLTGKIVSDKFNLLGKKIGLAFSINTAGNIAGALIAGLILLPLLGLQGIMKFGIAVNILLGIAIIALDNTLKNNKKIAVSASLGALLLAYIVFLPGWNNVVFTFQPFRQTSFGGSFGRFKKYAAENQNILFYKDGRDATVMVTRIQKRLQLFTNGKVEASTGTDMPTQAIMAHLPLILKPGAENVLAVGLASGVTCGAALRHPIKSLDVLEICPSVAQATKYFKNFNHDPLSDKRLHLYLEDAKTFLQRIDKKYDLIISEPSNPWASGIGELFSTEYFNDCARRLNPAGLMAQWVQAYEIDEKTFQTILRTFCAVFPDVSLWNISATDIIIIGSRRNHRIDLDESEKRMAVPSVKEDMARLNIKDLFTLLSLQIGSGETLGKYLNKNGPKNSDYFPIIEYNAPLALYTRDNVNQYIYNIDERKLSLENTHLIIKQYLKTHEISSAGLNNLYECIAGSQSINENLIYATAYKWHNDYPRDKAAIKAYTRYNTAGLEAAIALWRDMPDKTTDEAKSYLNAVIARYTKLRSFLTADVFSDTLRKIEDFLASYQDNKTWLYKILADLFLNDNNYEMAISYYKKAEELSAADGKNDRTGSAEYKEILDNMSRAYFYSGKLEEAVYYTQKALSADKNNLRTKTLLNAIDDYRRNPF